MGSTPVPIPRGIESNKSTYIFATLASQSARTSRFTPAASNTSASGFLRHYSGSFLTYPCWSSSKQTHTLELTPGQHLEDMSQESELAPWESAVAGAAGAVLANAMVYPLDIVKTRLQVQIKKKNQII